MEDKILSFQERSDLDYEIYENGAEMIVTTPQCQSCRYISNTNFYHCKHFKIKKKPSYIIKGKIECPKYETNNYLKIIYASDFERKVHGGVWGAILGDALGVPVEFSDRLTRKKDPVKEMRAHGTYRNPFGTWSDDSSMILCLIETINSGFSYDRLANSFVEFAVNGHLTPYGKVIDIGSSVSKAVSNIKSGVPPTECGGCSDRDNGNGSLMRILPLAFFLRNSDTRDMISQIENVSSITHAHPISKFACVFYVKIAIELINGNNKEDAYKKTIDFVNNELTNDYFKVLPIFNRLLSGKIALNKSKSINSSGYVLDTLEAAVWCFLNTKTYSDCVFKAINLGGDTDTTACVAGGLAGIYYGMDSIPDKWIQNLSKKHEINEMIKQFITVVK